MITDNQQSTLNDRILTKSDVRTSQNGFTLIELLVVTSLLGVIMTSIIAIYIAGIKTSSEENIRTSLTKNLTIATDNLTDDIRNASAIEGIYSSYTTGSSTVVLDLPAYDVNKNLLFSGNNFVVDRVVYTYASGTLKKYIFPDASSSRPSVSNKSVLSKIGSLSFSYSASPASASTQMTYAITVTDSFKNRTVSQTAGETLILRNH